MHEADAKRGENVRGGVTVGFGFGGSFFFFFFQSIAKLAMQNQSNANYFRHPSENCSNWRRFHLSELLECLAPLFHPIRSKPNQS